MYEFMALTVEISKAHGMSPFEVMNTDAEDVIMLVNYYLEKGDDEPTAAAPQKKNGKDMFWDYV